MRKIVHNFHNSIQYSIAEDMISSQKHVYSKEDIHIGIYGRNKSWSNTLHAKCDHSIQMAHRFVEYMIHFRQSLVKEKKKQKDVTLATPLNNPQKILFNSKPTACIFVDCHTLHNIYCNKKI